LHERIAGREAFENQRKSSRESDSLRRLGGGKVDIINGWTKSWMIW